MIIASYVAGAPRRCIECGEPLRETWARYHADCRVERIRLRRRTIYRPKRNEQVKRYHARRRILAMAMENLLEEQGVSVADFIARHR